MSKSPTDKVIHEGKNIGTILVVGLLGLFMLPAACGAVSDVAANSAKESLKTPAGVAGAAAGGVYGAKKLKEFKDSRGGGGGGGGGAAAGGGGGGAVAKAAKDKEVETPVTAPPVTTPPTVPPAAPTPPVAPKPAPKPESRITRDPIINLPAPRRGGLNPPSDVNPQPQGQLQIEGPRIGALTQ